MLRNMFCGYTRELWIASLFLIVVLTVAALALLYFRLLPDAESWSTIGSVLEGIVGSAVALAGALVAIRIAQGAVQLSRTIHENEQANEGVEFVASAGTPFGKMGTAFAAASTAASFPVTVYNAALVATFKETGTRPYQRQLVPRYFRVAEILFQSLANAIDEAAQSAQARRVCAMRAPMVRQVFVALRDKIHYRAEKSGAISPAWLELDLFASDPEAAFWGAPRILRDGAALCAQRRDALVRGTEEVHAENDYTKEIVTGRAFSNEVPEVSQIRHILGPKADEKVFALYLLSALLVPLDEDLIPGDATKEITIPQGLLYLFLIIQFLPTAEEIVNALTESFGNLTDSDAVKRIHHAVKNCTYYPGAELDKNIREYLKNPEQLVRSLEFDVASGLTA